MRTTVLALVCSLGLAQAAQAQDDWKINVYPVLAWVPLGLGIDVEVPPSEGGGDNGGSGSIVDGRFDGAFLGGVSASNGKFRIDADGIWAAVGGDRVERPYLKVDADVVYGHGSFGYAVAPDVFVTAGVRRFALKYDIELGDLPRFSRDPGVWDPLVGLAWHKLAGEKLEYHATFEGGGFGVGSDVELAGSFRFDWKPVRHFGLTAGYSYLYFKVTNTVRNREFKVTQSLHGPTLGIGLYF